MLMINSIIVFTLRAVLLVAAFTLGLSPLSYAESAPVQVNAFAISKLPDGYPVQEAFFASLRNTGANTLIIDMPMTAAGSPAIDAIPNAVYLAHQAGLKLHVVLPTRLIRGIVDRHADWEDFRFDPSTETYQTTGKLDLFHEAAVEYLASLAKELAAYSVDAVLLGSDFTYGPTEGMGRTAVSTASKHLRADIVPYALYGTIEKGPDGYVVRDFTPLFQRWNALKRDRLMSVYQSIKEAASAGNKSVKVGIPIPMTYPVMHTGEMFTQFAYDMRAFRNLDVDYFWAGIEYREMKKQRGFNYRQSMELASRLANVAVTASKDASKTILIVPMSEENASRSLPYSEIEEATALLKKAGNTGIAYGIKAGVVLNREFTNKLFRRQ